jgi:uncharacterized Fe-S cluster protein YjdI
MVFDTMDNTNREYTNGEITVGWKPDLCDHSAICIRELPKVFDNLRRPWVNMQGAPTADIQKVVDRCPTKALVWRYNNEKQETTATAPASTEIILVEGGPARISGSFEVKDEQGNLIKTENRISLCRCGKSKKMPYCDGSHRF